MEGFGVHTYTLLNKEGRVTYVKFHWQPCCGAPRALALPLGVARLAGSERVKRKWSLQAVMRQTSGISCSASD